MNGAIVSHNWAHDSPKAGFRFDSSPGRLGEGGYQGFNVAWNTGTGFMAKGDRHVIEHNLGLDEHDGRLYLRERVIIDCRLFAGVLSASSTDCGTSRK